VGELLRWEETFFKEMKSSSSHMSIQELADFAVGRDITEEAVLNEHVSQCPTCSGTLQKLLNVITLMRSDTDEDAPRDVIADAVGLFRRRSQPDTPSLLRRIIGILSFDSLTPAMAFGVRSGQSRSRQLIYSAEENDIDLRMTLQDEKWIIAGQVLSPRCVGGRVEIDGPQVSLTAQLNDLCEFTIEPLPPGKYLLRVKLTDMEVEIPQLELQS